MKTAKENDLQITALYRPGEFVTLNAPLVKILPSNAEQKAVFEQINSAFIIGKRRTSSQDVEFAINQLVEVAVRALSPGINDPFTTVTCIDWLGSALCKLAGRQAPSPYRYDDSHRLRIIAPGSSFSGIADAAFHPIRQYGHSSPLVMIHLLETIKMILSCARTDEQCNALFRHASMIHEACLENFAEKQDREDAEERFRKIVLRMNEHKIDKAVISI